MSIATGSRVCRCAVVGMLVAAGCSTDGSFQDAASQPGTERRSVILDYSPTLSDAGALLYLASNPSVELLAVTLPGTGETDCELGTRQTRALLVAAGNSDVPVGCGRNEPLAGARDWPVEWRNSLKGAGLPDVETEAVRDAEQLLVEVIGSAPVPVTIVTVGPLTNIGAVLADHADLVDQIERVVIMGGAFDVAGNVEDAPTAEWNLYIDPLATRLVMASGVRVLFVPLDATNKVPWTERFSSRLASLSAEPAHTMGELAKGQGSLDGFFMWDELAAMAAVRPELVTVSPRSVMIDDDGATVTDSAGVEVDVATDADDVAALDEFLRVLNRGDLPVIAPLSAAELDYMVALGGIDSQLGRSLGSVFALVGTSASPDKATLRLFLSGFVAALGDYAGSVSALTPPAALQNEQVELVDGITEFVGLEDEMLAAIDAYEGDDVVALIDGFLNRGSIRQRVGAACQNIVEYSFLRGGPRPCTFEAD